jgi:hypothetical protein
MPQRLYHITPPLGSEDPDDHDTSSAEPTESELSNSDWIEVDDTEWTDEQLKDDARPGRRRSILDPGTSTPDKVGDKKKQQFEQGLRQRNSADSGGWEVVEAEVWRSTVGEVREQGVADAMKSRKKSSDRVLSCFGNAALNLLSSRVERYCMRACDIGGLHIGGRLVQKRCTIGPTVVVGFPDFGIKSTRILPEGPCMLVSRS